MFFRLILDGFCHALKGPYLEFLSSNCNLFVADYFHIFNLSEFKCQKSY